MRCPVHNVEGCECAYAVEFRAAMLKTGEAPHPHFCDCDRCLNGHATAKKRASAPTMLALTFAAAVIACSGARPATCSERDAALLANEAACLARVKVECAGIPLDEPCPFEDSCKAFTRERCK